MEELIKQDNEYLVETGYDMRGQFISVNITRNKKLNKDLTTYILDDLTIDTELNQASVMEFTSLIPNGFFVAQGDEIDCFMSSSGSWDKTSVGLFKGKVFSIKYLKDNKMKVTAYDYLKYFASKHVMYIEPYKYNIATLFTTLCKQLNLLDLVEDGIKLMGEIDQYTNYFGNYLPESFEDDKTMFDIMNTAINTIYKQTGNLFMYFCHYGKLGISNASYNKVWRFENITLKATMQDFEYTSSIADGVYNRVIYYKDDYKTAGVNFFKKQMDDKTEDLDKDGKIDHYETISSWGILQYTEKIDDKTTNIDNDMRTFLRTHNKPKRTLELKDIWLDNIITPGEWLQTKNLIIGNINTTGQALISRIKLKFKKGICFADLTLKGGDFE